MKNVHVKFKKKKHRSSINEEQQYFGDRKHVGRFFDDVFKKIRSGEYNKTFSYRFRGYSQRFMKY
ncbi:hypothetical protein PGB90_003498 [Kerria lacca]